MINGLKNEAAWSNFTNGILGATATGSPTAELFMSSYNTKNGTELVYTDMPLLDKSTEDYDLYVPHKEDLDGCSGYWFASPSAGTFALWCMSKVGLVDSNLGFNYPFNGVRPVVSLPLSTTAELVDEVWKVLQ